MDQAGPGRRFAAYCKKEVTRARASGGQGRAAEYPAARHGPEALDGTAEHSGAVGEASDDDAASREGATAARILGQAPTTAATSDRDERGRVERRERRQDLERHGRAAGSQDRAGDRSVEAAAFSGRAARFLGSAIGRPRSEERRPPETKT
jgi:hypothetical protein